MFKSIDELVGVAKAQAPDWKTISFDIPTAQQKTVNFTVNTSSSGGQVSNTQLVVNRETGSLQPTRGNASTSLGQKLRMWARFLHTGEQFGVIGETIALLATLGGIFLVWTGISLAIWRVMTAWRRSIDPDTKRGPSVEEEAESAS